MRDKHILFLQSFNSREQKKGKMGRPVSLLPRESHIGEQKTRMTAIEDSYGFTWGKILRKVWPVKSSIYC